MKNNVSCISIAECVGCFACKSICPVNAIKNIIDDQGFHRPFVSDTQCVDCGRCLKVCPAKEKTTEKQVNVSNTYIAASKDKENLQNSTSGGVFYTIASFCINNYNSVIYGAICNPEERIIKHIRIDNINDLLLLRGSKYVQSILNGVYTAVKNDLVSNRSVVFSGTPCQIDAVRRFLGKEYPNLLCVDIICHGVSSPQMWKEHIDTIEEKKKKKVISYRFRSKVNGWHSHTEEVVFNDGAIDNKSLLVEKNKYLFDYNYNLRPSCYQCKYTNLNRIGDITIGDCWGIEKCFPEMDRNTGLSLVLTNTIKGQSLFEGAAMEFDYKCIKLCKELLQRPLQNPVEMPKDYDDFWNLYHKEGYLACTKKYGRYNPMSFLKDVILKIDNKLSFSIIKRIVDEK